jgi:RNA polymerase sigma-70 factor, ECF subfamily
LLSLGSVKDTDRTLVEALRRGDKAAFETLYARYVARIHNYAVSKLGSVVEAEDVTQEAFEAVFQCIDKFEGRSDLVVWIYGITRNLIHNRIRRRAGDRLVALEEAAHEAAPEMLCPDRQAEARESLRRMREAIEALPADQRRILELRHEKRLAIRRIAELMHRSEDAVKSSLYRTRRSLANRLPDLTV